MEYPRFYKLGHIETTLKNVNVRVFEEPRLFLDTVKLRAVDRSTIQF